MIANGTPIATFDTTGLHFYLNDLLGTRRAQTDSAGVLEQTCTSLPFGDQLNCNQGLVALMILKTERSNAQRELLTYLGQKLKHHGFDPKPVGHSFWQKKPTGQRVFHISFIPHEKDFDLTADVAVRIDEIEDLVNKYDSKRTPAEKKKSMTFGGELGNLSQGRPMRWTIENVDDIPMIGEAVMNAFDNVAWPFFEKNSDLEAAHKILTSEKPTDILLAPILGSRYMRAVASAHLLNERQELRILVPRYEKRLRGDGDLYLNDFLSLCGRIILRAANDGFRLS